MELFNGDVVAFAFLYASVGKVSERQHDDHNRAAKLQDFAVLRGHLRKLYSRRKTGSSRTLSAGGMAEPTGATRPWTYGDAGQIAVQRTVFNAVARAGSGARLLPEDFEESSGELTPTLKVRRPAVQARFAAEIEALYADAAIRQTGA